MKPSWMFAVLVACSGKPATTGHPNGSDGSAGGTASTCESVRPRVEELYRAEAKAKEPKRVDDAVADNTTMVMNDCARAPDKVVACVNAAKTVADLERTCLRPLDEEGTEGLELRK